jgi:Zn-dependent protease with chaperone function
MPTAAALAVSCVVLFVALPLLLVRARWPTRAPRAAVVLWQTIGLAGSCSAIGTGLAIAVAPLHTSLSAGVTRMIEGALAGHPLAGLGLYEALGLTLATDVAVVLGGGLVVTVVRTLRSRAHHRRVLDLVSEQTEVLPGTMILDHPRAVAYCVPGLRPRIVLSHGTLCLLRSHELDAVVAHERGHTLARHDLVMLPFASLVELLRWLPYARLAPVAVAGLLEMAADDFACRFHDRRTIASALVHLATAGIGTMSVCTLGAADSEVLLRVRRLLRSNGNSRATGLLALVAAGAILAAPFIAMMSPALAR